MTKVIVFGATGLVGKAIVKECLLMKMEVAAYTRLPSYDMSDVKVVQGNLDEEDKIAATIKNYDVVISSVGNRNYEDATKVVAPLTRTVCKHIRADQRFVLIAGSGLTLSAFNELRRNLPGQPEFLKNQRADHWEAYCQLAPLDINYLVVCPTMIVEGEPNDDYVLSANYFPQHGNKEIYAGNVGRFVAKELEEKNFIKVRVGLANKA